MSEFKADQAVKDKANYNKWLKELKDHEIDLVVCMLSEAYDRGRQDSKMLEMLKELLSVLKAYEQVYGYDESEIISKAEQLIKEATEL